MADVGIRDLIAEHAAATPAAPAVIFPGLPPVTYRDLDELVRVTIGRLEALGVTARDRIAVAVPDGPAGLAVLLAAMSLAVCAPVSPLCTEEEFARALEVMGISVAVAPQGAASLRRAAAARQIPVVTPVARPGPAGPPEFRGTLLDGAPVAERHRTRPAEIPEQLLLMTSGTTAAGKVVPLTVPNVLAAAGASARAYRLSAADRRLNCMPLFHVQGLVGSVITALSAGSSVVCLPGFEPAAVLAALAEHGATWFSGTPAMHRSLLGAGAAAAGPFSRLRFVRCGSAWLPNGLRAALEDAYGVPVTESYGMTEAHQIASTPLPPDAGQLGMMPTGARVAIRTDDGMIAESPGASGEVVVSGPNVARRYLWPPEATSAFVDGWLRTGDCGRLERDGSLVLTGRLKELINRGGEKVYPREVEEVLLRHPDVGDAVVFSIPDPVFTEEVAAAVVPRADRVVSEPRLLAFARASLSPHKLPRRVIVRAELPTGATGKHQRNGLAELFAAELGYAWRADADTNGTAGGGDDVADALEAALAGIWAYLLGRPGVGRDTDFFALGGNSLLAASLLTIVGDFFRTKISSLEFYDEASTVARMAALLRRSWRDASPARTAAVQAG